MKQLIFRTSDFIKSDTIERRVEKFEEDIGYPCDIAVDIKAVRISDDTLSVSGAVEGYVNLECARCLTVYRHPVELYIETEMDFFNGEVDMGDEIRQRLILGIPSKPLCEQDCLGICPKCGKRNTVNDKCSCKTDESESFAKARWTSLFSESKK